MFSHTIAEMTLSRAQTALVLTDMQNDFLSPGGGAYPLLEKSFARNDTVRIHTTIAGSRQSRRSRTWRTASVCSTARTRFRWTGSRIRGPTSRRVSRTTCVTARRSSAARTRPMAAPPMT